MDYINVRPTANE